MIKHVYENEKVKRIILGSGGSAFVDAGIGAIHALGVFNFHLYAGGILAPDKVPLVKDLHEIEYISKKDNSSILSDLEIIMPCDVDNPLLGPNGAAYVYGP
jgi:glycerate kinase